MVSLHCVLCCSPTKATNKNMTPRQRQARRTSYVNDMMALKGFFGSDADVEADGFDANELIDHQQAAQLAADRRAQGIVDDDTGGMGGPQFYSDTAKLGADTGAARRMVLHAFGSEKDLQATRRRERAGCCSTMLHRDQSASLLDLACMAMGLSCMAGGAAAVVFAFVLLGVSEAIQDDFATAAMGVGVGFVVTLGGFLSSSAARRGYSKTAWALLLLTLVFEGAVLVLLAVNTWGGYFVVAVAGMHLALLGCIVVLFVVLVGVSRQLSVDEAPEDNGNAVIPSAFARDQVAFKKEREAAARLVQRLERGRASRRRARRLVELRVWYAMARERGLISALAHVIVLVYVGLLAYVAYLYGSLYPTNLVSTWIVGCAVSVVLEALVVEPFTILIRFALYDVWPIVVRKRKQRRLQRERKQAIRDHMRQNAVDSAQREGNQAYSGRGTGTFFRVGM